MKRTFTALTAIVFASALALPAFAQMGMNSNPASSTSSSSTTESNSQYRVTEPGSTTNSVERSERDYKSEKSDAAAPADPSARVQSRSEKDVTTSSTTESAPPPPVENSSSTTTTTHRAESGY